MDGLRLVMIVQWEGYDIENLPTPGHDKIGMMVTIGTLQIPVPDIKRPFLFSLPPVSSLPL